MGVLDGMIDRLGSRVADVRHRSDPAHVGDGYRLDGSDGRVPEIAGFMRMAVDRFENAPDADVLRALGSPRQRREAIDLPESGSARRNAIRDMVVDAFRLQPADEPASGPIHEPRFMAALTRKLVHPERLAFFSRQPVDGINLADANRNVSAFITSGVLQAMRNDPAERMVEARRIAGMPDKAAKGALMPHPDVRMDAMPADFDGRVAYAADILDARNRELAMGMMSADNAVEVGMGMASYRDRVKSREAISTVFVGVMRMNKDAVRLRGLGQATMSDAEVKTHYAHIPGVAEMDLPPPCSAGFRGMAMQSIVEVDFARRNVGMVPGVAAGFDENAERERNEREVARIAERPGGMAALWMLKAEMDMR